VPSTTNTTVSTTQARRARAANRVNMGKQGGLSLAASAATVPEFGQEFGSEQVFT
jgi:hypothetical protein